MQFEPTENFVYQATDETGFSRVVASYVQGARYHCRTPQLVKKAQEWAAEGKVTLFDVPPEPVRNSQREAV